MDMTEESVALSTALSTSITPTVDMTRSKAMSEEESAALSLLHLVSSLASSVQAGYLLPSRLPTVTAYRSQSSHTSHPELYHEKRYYPNNISHLVSCHVDLQQEYDRWLAAEVQAKNARALILAATIPSELLDCIAGYVSSCTKPHCNCAGGDKKGSFYHRSWAPLRIGSLVCRRWANICRSNMFKSLKAISLYYPQDCETFIAYTLHGCPSLVPIHKLISGIYVSPKSHAASSFFHRLCVLPNEVLEHIRIEFHLLGLSYGLTTPHWSIPPTVVTPYSLMSCYDSIYVESVHMPSFSHMIAFIRHFAYTATGAYARNPNNQNLWRLTGRNDAAIMFLQLTWDNDQEDYLPQFRVPALYRRSYHPWTAITPRSYHSTVSAMACTSDTRLCMHAIISRPTCCMHWLPDDERRWIFSLMTEVLGLMNDGCGACSSSAELVDDRESLSDPDVLIDSALNVMSGSQWRKSGILKLSFDLVLSGPMFGHQDELPHVTIIFYLEALPHDSKEKSGNRMIGLELFTRMASGHNRPVNLDALFSWLRRNIPSRRLVVVLSWPYSIYGLQRHTSQYRPISTLQDEAYNLLFICRTHEKVSLARGGRDRRHIISIDPITLVPTGQFWEHKDDIIPSLCNIPLPTPETEVEADTDAGDNFSDVLSESEFDYDESDSGTDDC